MNQHRHEVEAYERGERPDGPANDPPLLVVGVDGGRVQSREKNPETQSRWREDKVATISSCLKGDGQQTKPRPLVTTHVATMAKCKGFGKLVRVEAERRGIRQAPRTLFIGDGANWIDKLWEKHFFHHPRIIDYYHAAEHLYEVAKAMRPNDDAGRKQLGDALKQQLWDGQLDALIETLAAAATDAGPPKPEDSADHPRRVLAQNVGYFKRHRHHMDYPAYRARGWPIGSGITESAVKQFNKRVKGTDQFWHEDGVEPILALRALWLSQDDRWSQYWKSRRLPRQAA